MYLIIYKQRNNNIKAVYLSVLYILYIEREFKHYGKVYQIFWISSVFFFFFLERTILEDASCQMKSIFTNFAERLSALSLPAAYATI